jgi:hypothetical protein
MECPTPHTPDYFPAFKGHGQWRITELGTGRQWSVVDTGDGFDFEVVSEGDT